MSLWKTACILVLIASALIAFLLIMKKRSGETRRNDTEKASGYAKLNGHEERVLRNQVYGAGSGTSIAIKGPWATHRVLVVPDKVGDLHKKKRIATLRLLLEIVRGGRPDDAVSATAYAIALEENPVLAAPLVDYSLDEVDAEVGENELSGRQRLIEIITELLVAAEKQEQAGK